MLTYQEKLRVIRKALGYEQKEMAQMLNISQPSYSRLEVNQDISISNLQVLFNSFNVSPLWFFLDIEPMFLQVSEETIKDISTFLKTHTILFQIQQKIKIQGEKTFWQNIFNSFEGAFELFFKALSKDFSDIMMQNAKKTLLSTIEGIPLNKFGFGINTFEADKNKLLNFIEGLEDMECFIILSNAQDILATINQSRMFFNRRS